MKKYFFTGLAILLPFTLTLMVAFFIVNILTAPFMGITESLFGGMSAFQHPYFIFSGQEVLVVFSRIFALTALFGTILGLGLFAQWVFGVRLLRLIDNQIRRIPIINKLYITVQDTVKMLFDAPKASFSQVVLIPYPHPKALSLGLLPEKQPENIDSDSIAVFMPGAAMPAMGLMMVYRRKDVIYLDMKVEDALKSLLSCGIILPEINKASNQYE
jgi:uncharacterized membrane protein